MYITRVLIDMQAKEEKAQKQSKDALLTREHSIEHERNFIYERPDTFETVINYYATTKIRFAPRSESWE